MSTVLEIVDAGPQTTVQDYPGRIGRLADGVSQAGPMDHVALRAANLLAGNEVGAAALEVTLGGLRVRFPDARTIAVCGAIAPVTLDGEEVPLWHGVAVAAGQELRIRMSNGPGFRLYLAVSGGIDVEPVFGSRSTHTLAALGGLDGRALRRGDRLALGPDQRPTPPGRRLRVPDYTREWAVEVMLGPQAAPDFLTPGDVEKLSSRAWSVDAASNRTGLRLEPFDFAWARSGGGIAGGHPSNVLDDGYPPGGVNMNGDTAVILGPDGPTSGGFVVIATVVHGALWKLGQVRPGGDRIRFKPVTIEQAVALAREVDGWVAPAAVRAR